MTKIQLREVNPDKLSDEFVSAGIHVVSALSDLKQNEFIAQNATFGFNNDVKLELVHKIVDEHDPTPLPSSKSEVELLKEELSNTNAMLLDMMEIIVGGI